MTATRTAALLSGFILLLGVSAASADGNDQNAQGQQAEQAQATGSGQDLQNAEPTNPPGPTGKAVVFNPGWGCRTCGFSNGTSLTGLVFE